MDVILLTTPNYYWDVYVQESLFRRKLFHLIVYNCVKVGNGWVIFKFFSDFSKKKGRTGVYGLFFM